MPSLNILKTSHYMPPHIVTNDDLKEFVDTNDEWIKSRTGVATRHFAKDETNLSMALHVAENLLNDISPDEIGGIIVATFTNDYHTPSMACMLQNKLGLSNDILALDINAACSGFLYGLHVAKGLLLQNPTKKIMIIGSEKISPYMDFTDRNTCILFGDGAGGIVVELSEQGEDYFSFQTFGDDVSIVCKKDPSDPYIHMNGKSVFVFAVNAVLTGINRTLEAAGLTLSDIDHFVCHQANQRIIKHVYEKLKLSPDKFFMNLQHYGNTSGASVPIALDEMVEQGLLHKGDKVLIIGFGSGLTWGASLITW